MNRRTRRAGGAVAALALGAMLSGCAAGIGGASFGPGLGLGLRLGEGAPRLGLTSPSCLLHGSAAPQAATGMMSAATIAGARMDQIAAAQARLSAGNPPFSTLTIDGWRRAATGGC